MMSCKEVSLLVSKASDTRLTWRERLAVHLHLLFCQGCMRFQAQVRFLRTAVRTLAGRADDTARPGLSPAARDRIAAKLRKRD